MKTPKYLRKIEFNLQSFCLDGDIEHLTMARGYLSALIQYRVRLEDKAFFKRLNKKINSLNK